MKVMFLAPEFPLPANSGLKVRVLSQLELLSSIEEVESISLLTLSSVPVPDDALRALQQTSQKLKAETPIVRGTSVRRDRAALLRFLRQRLLHKEPYIVAINSCQAMRSLVSRHLDTEQYAVVYIGYLGMMSYLSTIRKLAPRARVVLEQHNLEWQIFDRVAREHTPPMRQLVKLEALALRTYEREAMRQVDTVIAISETDAIEFRHLAQVGATVIPPFIEPKETRIEKTEEPHVGYIGHLAWQPNVYGLSWFCRDVWPRIRECVPNARFTIAGPGLSKDSSGKVQAPPEWQGPGISAVGYIDDLKTLYDSALIMVAPIIGGSGVRMKILETLSAGMPTVTTTDGAAGLDVGSGRELLIADEPQAFADAVIEALGDPDLRARLRRGGYRYLEANHSHAASTAKLKRALRLAD